MKKLILASGALVALFLALWAFAHVFLRLKGPVLIERIVQEKTGLVIHVSAVQSHYLTSLELHNIEIKQPVSIVIPQLIISLHPSVFPIHIDLLDPKILARVAKSSSVRSPMPPLPLPVQIDIVNADVTVVDEKKSVHAHGVGGTARLSALVYDAQINGISSDGGSFEVQAALDNHLNQPWRVSVLVPQAKLEQLAQSPYFPTEKMKGLSGEVRLEAHASGGWLAKNILQDWKFDVAGKNLRWKTDDGMSIGPVRGRAQLDPQGIENIDVALAQARLRGAVHAAWSSPGLDLTLRVPDGSDIKDILRSFGLEHDASTIRGRMGALAQVQGTPSHPVLSGSFNAEPTLGALGWPLLEGHFSYEKQLLRIDADTLSGHLKMNGNFAEGKPTSLQWTLQNVSLSQLATFNGWRNARGTLDGKGELALGDNAAPLASGSFRVRQFEWGRLKAKPVLNGLFALADRKVQLKTDNNGLELVMTRSDDIWKIVRARVELNPSSHAELAGTFSSIAKTCDLHFEGTNIPPDTWPPLVARYPQIAGGLNFSGSMRGAWNAAHTDLDVDFSKIQFSPHSRAWDGSAKAHGDGAQWVVEDFTVAPGYQGRVEWSMQNGAPDVHVSAHVNNADPKFLFDLARSTTNVEGKLNGTIDVRWDGRDLIGISSASCSPGKVGNFAFDVLDVGMRFDKNVFYLDDVSLVRGQRALRGRAELDRSRKDWDVNADVQFQNWGSEAAALNGETTITGSAGINPFYLDLSLTTPFLELNNVPLEDMVAKATYRNGAWTLSAKAQDFFNANLHGNTGNDTIKGSVAAQGLDLKAYLPRLLPRLTERPEGRADIVLNVDGTLEDPNASFSFKSDDILWREEHLSPVFNATYRDGVVALRDGRVAFHNGGSLHFSGHTSPDQSGSFELKGTGNKMALQSVIHLIHIPLRWQGRVGGTFDVVSSSGHVNTTISFEGMHDGFAAFEDGGKMAGTVTGVDGEWDFSNVRVNTGDGYVSSLPGSKIYLQKDGSANMHMSADIRNVRTGMLSFFGGVEITGSWKKVPSTDTVSEPVTITELEIFARSLWVNHYVLDGNITRLNIGKGELEFLPIPGSGQQMSGVLHYENFPTLRIENFRLMDRSEEKIFLNGLIGADKWDFDLRAHGMSTDVLRSFVSSDVSLDGSLDANLKGLGTPLNPDLSGHVVWHNGKIGFLPLDSAECELHYQDHYLNITKLSAARKNGYVLSGTVRFYAGTDDTHELDPDIDLQIEKGDMSFLRDVLPSVSHARGSFSGRLQMQKKSWGTSIAGFFNADKVSMSTAHIPALEKGLLKITLDKNRLHVEEAKAVLGNGNLQLSGYIDFADGVPSFYNLSLQTPGERGIRLRVPELSISPGPVLGKIGFVGASKGEPLVNLILKGPSDAPLLAGAITLENTVFTYPPSAHQQQPIEGENTQVSRWIKRFMDTLQWDVSVVAGRRTWYQNELVDANVHGDLQFKGPTRDLAVKGSIQTEQGALVYSGNEFQIRSASLDIETQGPLLNDASTKQTLVYLKANADREVFYTDNLGNGTEDTIVMQVDRSLLGEVQPRFYSKNNPSLSPEKALQLALGLPLSTPVENDAILPDQRAASNASKGQDIDAGMRLGMIQLLDSSLASPLARAIARNTGLVDYIRVSYQEKDKYEETDPLRNATAIDATNSATQSEFLRYAKGTKVRFGKGLSDRLFADYSFRVDEYQNQVDLRHEVELSYRVHRNLFLRGTSELDRQQVLGRPPDHRAVLENQWRFGLPQRKIPDPEIPSNPARKPS